MIENWLYALAGGALIGLAAGLLLLTHGRVAGISGIAGRLFALQVPDRGWRAAFVAGLVVVGAIATLLRPGSIGVPAVSLPVAAVAGLLVGVGTRLGNGCTSGHGVCGLSRFSLRSLVAVGTFMTTGALTTWLAGGAS